MIHVRPFHALSALALSLVTTVLACSGVAQTEGPSSSGGKCCPPSASPSACMNLGGYAESGTCIQTCDFPCAANFRLEKDAHGCEAWVYDTFAPGQGGDGLCLPVADAGPDAKADAAPDADSGPLPYADGGDGSMAAACCPIDDHLSGCMQLGGANTSSVSCSMTCDFFCSCNWRQETDLSGCKVWRYDTNQTSCSTDAGLTPSPTTKC